MKSIYIVCAAFLALAPAALAAPVQVEASARALEIRGAAPGDYFGRPIVCGDFDGDGYEDIVTCADRSTFGAGQRPTLYLFKGRPHWPNAGLTQLTTETLTGGADAVILGETGSTNLATALAAGDVNGDNYTDLIAADSSFAAAGRASAGAVYVFFGGAAFFNTPVRDLASGAWSLKILGSAAGDDTGGSLMFGGMHSKGLAAGDLTGDGIADIAIGAHLANANSRADSGKVSIVKGKTTFTPGTTIDLANQADATVLGNEEYGELGTAIAIGDINGDSIGDLVLGEEYGSITVFSTHGRVFVIFGSAQFPSVNLLTQSANVTITGKATYDSFGTAVAVADVNNDSRLDLIASSPGWDPAGTNTIEHGAIYAFFGRTSWPASLSLASQNGDVMVQGFSQSNIIGSEVEAGDFNGDGIGDMLFSSRDAGRTGYPGEGRTYIVYGRAGIPATLSLLNEEVEVIINGGASGFQLGDTIGRGDTDADGADEMLLAAPFLESSTGRLFLFDLTPPPTAACDWPLFE